MSTLEMLKGMIPTKNNKYQWKLIKGGYTFDNIHGTYMTVDSHEKERVLLSRGKNKGKESEQKRYGIRFGKCKFIKKLTESRFKNFFGYNDKLSTYEKVWKEYWKEAQETNELEEKNKQYLPCIIKTLPDFLEVSNKYNFLAYVLNFDELFTSESYEITDEEIEKVAKETDEEIEITIKTIKNYTSNHMDKRIEEVKNELDNAEYKIKLACNQTIEEFVLSIDDEKIKNLLNERTYRIYKNLFLNCISLKNLKQQYKKMAKKLHTDKGGNEKEFIGMKQAYEEVKELFEL